MANRQLLIIDAQFDFTNPNGALYVKNAEKDTERLAKFITNNTDKIDDIRCTLDSHQPVHIAHPIAWVDSKGNHPSPFTMISEADVTGPNAKYRAFNPSWQTRQVDYVKSLAAGKRYALVIWPPHCLIGTNGHAIDPVLQPALRKWQDEFAMIDFVTKGSNPFTEHYSVVKADVPDPSDPSTNVNTSFIERLQQADEILIAGQALSHCVANSVRDIADLFGPDQVKKFVLLEDASSPVGDQAGSTMFQDMADAFIKEMTGRGMRLAKTTDF